MTPPDRATRLSVLRVRVYRIDAATGLLSYASGPVSVPTPVCVLMRTAGP